MTNKEEVYKTRQRAKWEYPKEDKTFNRQEENVQLLNKLMELVSKPEYKDIRLGQLLSNALGDKDLFFIESSELEKLLG